MQPDKHNPPANFPDGYLKRNGMYYKVDDAGNVIELRNIYGREISDFADINIVIGNKAHRQAVNAKQ